MFEQRLKDLRSQFKNQNIDAAFVSSVADISYLTGYSNFSKEEREAYLIIGPTFQYLITDGRYSEAVKKSVPHFTLFERGYKNKTEDLLKLLKNKVKTIGINEDNLTVLEYKLLKKHFKKIRNFEVSEVRAIKDSEEIKKISKACQIGDQVFEETLKRIRLGISEKQLAFEMEYFVKQKGFENSFPTIVAFSKNSSIPHHHTGHAKLLKKAGQFILLDFGVKVADYCSDMTRTIFFGEPSKKQLKIYQTVLNAQLVAIKFLKESLKRGDTIKASKVDEVARNYIISQGYPAIPHALGHGIGIEVHEQPYVSFRSDEVLKEGMVFSIEPGIYLEGFGGVRIEDLFVLEKGKIRQLTTSPKGIIKV